jgi:hypothetical protein
MLPDLRFAIGAVLASALLIVAAFGLAATVRIAQHQAATPDDPWRTLAFTDPNDMGLLADRPQHTPAKAATKTEAPEVSRTDPAGTTADPDTTGAINKSERRGEAADPGERLAPPDAPPATVTPSAPAEPAVGPTNPVEVVAAVPQPAAEPVQATPASPRVETPRTDDAPLESSERVSMLPGFPTAGPGFVPIPPQHPIALPVPDPRGKAAVKQPAKKKIARRRYRFAPLPPLPDTGYPVTGFPEFKFPATGSDKKRTVLGE